MNIKNMMLATLLVVAAGVAVNTANAEIKREDYPSYSAYLAAKSAQTAAEMEKELAPKPEPMPAKKTKPVAENYKKVDEDEFGESGVKRKVDRDTGIVTIAHNFGHRATCKIMVEQSVVAQKELRDREEWTYKHGGRFSGAPNTTCTAGSSYSFKVDNDGTRWVIKNLASNTSVCRVRIAGRPTVDTVIAPDMSRSFKMPKGASRRANCHAGTQYTGDLSNEPMQVAKEG